MKQLILEEWLSLDGFAEDANGKTEFFPTTQENKQSDEEQLRFLEGIDTILLGRKTYQIFADYWPTPKANSEILAPRLNEIPKVVISNTLDKAPWGKTSNAKIIGGDAIKTVQSLKEQSKKDIVIWGSLSLAQSLIEAQLINEYRLHICPTAVGSGRRLFPDTDVYKSFELKETRNYDTGVIFLKYKPKE
jgi:dihydrofolate reductase